MQRTIVISIPVEQSFRLRAQEIAPAFTFHFVEEEGPQALLDEAEILFGDYYDMATVPHAGKLRWIQVLSSGVERFLAPGVLPADAMLTSATGAYGTMISEFMLAQILTLNYKFPTYRDQQNTRTWQDAGYPHTIAGRHALILGLGNIGTALAKLLHGMGAFVSGVRRSDTAKPAFVDALYTFQDPAMDSLFAQADIIAMCMPSTPETANILSAARITQLKPSAIVVNVGRGSAIDEAALALALQEGRIQGAALDVFQAEPLPQESPLWGQPRALLTPHVAGRDRAPEVLQNSLALFLRNLEAYVAGKPLESLVDPKTMYASGREK